MELREFATTILFESSLAAKIEARPSHATDGSPSFSDTDPGSALATPLAPGRPLGLELKPRGASERVPFPASAAALADPINRGVVLHFFANHEMLAMELMALALLKFPDAPAGFRQGLARTIIEEQKHLSLYMQRMAELGVSFGTTPVNRYFWDCIADMQSPLEYVTKMSLTLEQANLDFSRHFRDLFAQLGDTVTSELLDVVYREEIGHVKHGVVWFNRWRPGEGDDWDEYQRLLPGPLTPVRAKGLGFDRDARRLAGLSERFIHELAVYKHSKGRPPVVYWFNPACEIEIANPAESFKPPAVLERIRTDLAGLMQYLTKGDDVVWVPKRPTSNFLADVQAVGLPIPQFIEEEAELLGRPVSTVEPWGQSPASRRRQESMGLKSLQPKQFVSDWRIFSKAFSASLLADMEPSSIVGKTFDDPSAVIAFVESHFRSAASPLVLKAPFGSSGRGMLRVKAPGLEPKQIHWVRNVIESQGAVVAEPWLERILDLSVQVNVANDKRPVLGVTRFLTDTRGQYIGHKLGRKFGDLSPDLRRALHEDGMLARLESTARQVLDHLAASGYVGPAGIDALVYLDQGVPKLKPIVEINPRYTMGRIALEIDRHVHHTVDAEWLHLSSKQVQAMGYPNFAAFVAEGKARFPAKRQGGRTGLLVEGFVATNDPETATVIQTVLALGPAIAFVRAETAL